MSRDVFGLSLSSVVRYVGMATVGVLAVVLEVGLVYGQREPVHLEQVLGDAGAGAVENPARSTEVLPARGSRAFIRQSEGPRNRARVEQRGDGHVSLVFEIGGRNEVEVLQLGRNNRAGAQLRGTGNVMSLHQSGSGNRFLLKVNGDGLGRSGAYEAQQDGVGNHAVQLRGR